MNIKLDLCGFLGVVEGEEFKIYDEIYVVQNNKLFEKSVDGYKPISLCLNYILKTGVTKIPQKKRLTSDELCIMRSFDKRFNWMAKDKNGDVCLFFKKPKKMQDFWHNEDGFAYIDVFKDNIFSSISYDDDEPVYIFDYVDKE